MIDHRSRHVIVTTVDVLEETLTACGSVYESGWHTRRCASAARNVQGMAQHLARFGAVARFVVDGDHVFIVGTGGMLKHLRTASFPIGRTAVVHLTSGTFGVRTRFLRSIGGPIGTIAMVGIGAGVDVASGTRTALEALDLLPSQLLTGSAAAIAGAIAGASVAGATTLAVAPIAAGMAVAFGVTLLIDTGVRHYDLDLSVSNFIRTLDATYTETKSTMTGAWRTLEREFIWRVTHGGL
jgi:hypothetical protein